MRIKTWKAWHDPKDHPDCTDSEKHSMLYPSPCRIVPEATWRKVMAVVKASQDANWTGINKAIDALREHEEKRK